MEKEFGHENESHLLENLMEMDIQSQRFHRQICTRFPPEPNGYLHVGSAYAIHLNASLAQKFGGKFHLRFDDTNPLKEDAKFVEAILEDIKWLGYDPGHHVYFGSDYAEMIYEAAVKLIRKGVAYVCELRNEEMTLYRGTLTEAGKDSPYRNRSVEENLERFDAMREGRISAGACVLRAKINMASPNMNLRDPVLYRIIHAHHYRTGNDWCIYPMYDFAHPIQDFIEGITHSLCSIEFKDHRPLYEWVLEQLECDEPPYQREFGRLNISGTVTSKRYLRQLVEEGFVDGWDDPRLPTLRGMRRRGYSSESIKCWLDAIGLIRHQSTVDPQLLDHFARMELKKKAKGCMIVIDPIKVVITNLKEEEVEWLTIPCHTEDEQLGSREVAFTRELYIEREDFMENPIKGFHRLTQDGEVRLKGAYFIQCQQVIKDERTGLISELHCTYDPLTKSGTGFQGRKVKGTIHWVSAKDAIPLEVRFYRSLLKPDIHIAEEHPDWASCIQQDSLVTYANAVAEPMLQEHAGDAVQFVRHGYFIEDAKDSSKDRLVFNRIVPLKDTWKK